MINNLEYDDRLLSSISDQELSEVSICFWGLSTPRLHVYAGENIINSLVLGKTPLSDKMSSYISKNPEKVENLRYLLLSKGFKLPAHFNGKINQKEV